MSHETPLQDWLRGVGEQSLFAVRNHVAAETTADTDTICATVSHDVFFAVPQRTRDGNALPPGAVLTSYDEVRDYYAARADTYVVVDSKHLKSIAGDWYVFNESAATLRGTGDIGGTDATGTEFVVNSAILFPTADDGIRGEICVTRHPFEDVVAGAAPPPAPNDASYPALEMSHTGLLDRFVEALRADTHQAVGEVLAPDHTLAIRMDAQDGSPKIDIARNRIDAQKILHASFSDARDIAIVSRIATDWYVFAEYVAQLDGGGLRRFAAIHPIEAGKLTGTFGYGRTDPTRG
jgi:hypothetical protein